MNKTTTTRSSSKSPTRTPQRHKKDIKQFRMLYGCAWKKDNTKTLVNQAIKLGFRGIDTAGQPKHYNEKGAGDGIAEAIANKYATRDELFIQTKYSPISAQNLADINPSDPTKAIPYHINDDIETQVHKSLHNSLKNLQVDYLDSWVLHGPLDKYTDTLRAWRAMESFVDQNIVDRLGISNCYSLDYFKQLYNDAKHKPQVLQNRFYKDSKWDVELRQFCRENDVAYQSFWTLSANPTLLSSSKLTKVAQAHQITPEATLYRYIIQRGGQPLNGSTTPQHIIDDLNGTAPDLPPFSDEEIASIASLIRDQ